MSNRTVDLLATPPEASGSVPAPVATWADALSASVVSTSRLAFLDVPRRNPLIGDWFKESNLGFIFAPRGRGKTWFTLLFAECLATGRAFGRWPVHEPVKTLYLDGEMAADAIKERTSALSAEDGNELLLILNHELLFHASEKTLNLGDAEVQAALTAHIVSTGVRVVVLDNLSCLFPGVGENDNDEWFKVQPWLLTFRRLGVAVVIVHHAGRNGLMRGASKREDQADWIISLDEAGGDVGPSNGARFVSRFTKCRGVESEPPCYEWHFSSEGGKTVANCKEASALDVFRQWVEDGLTTCSDIAKEMGVSAGKVSKLAKRAVQDGWLVKEAREYRVKAASE